MRHTPSFRLRVKRHCGLAVTVLAAISAIYAVPRVAQVGRGDAGASGVAHMLPSYIVTAAAKGGYLGFDTSIYPGDDAMQAWREGDQPYHWVGYYLPAPCHKDASWSGKRERLADMGWGVAVIYVGQQTWGKTPRLTPKGKSSKPTTCSSDFVSADRGRRDADDAIRRTQAEQFDSGTVVFLDVERMDFMPPAMRDYYRAWAARMLEDGRYRPGVYAHKDNARVIYTDLRGVFAAAGKTGDPPFWVASGRNFSIDKMPQDVGHDFAHVWQGILDIVETRNGVRLPIDVNVSEVPSPSDGQYALGN